VRIAVTTGLLPIPPLYFVVQHALRLADRHDFHVLARAADVRDQTLGLDVDSAVPTGLGPWSLRQYLALAAGGTHARRIRAVEADVVHQHFATWMHGPVAARRPLITTLHGYDVAAAEARERTPLARFHARSTGLAIEHSTRLLAVSRSLADRAVAAGFPAERLDVHYQGIDTDFFTPASASSIDTGTTGVADAGPVRATDEPPSLVFVGALAVRKGLPDLLRASIALAATTPHRLRVIGAGPLEAEVRAAAAQNPHIEALGSLPREGVRDAVRRARALVLPTQRDGQWREAAGLVLLEAQACGTPALAYASGGTPEMIVDGETGVLVAERDEVALTDAMRILLVLPEAEHAAMRLRARQWVVAERSLTTSAEQLDAVYREVGA
jgi:glycosyltransferase involved in cell wall biosynthesis